MELRDCFAFPQRFPAPSSGVAAQGNAPRPQAGLPLGQNQATAKLRIDLKISCSSNRASSSKILKASTQWLVMQLEWKNSVK